MLTPTAIISLACLISTGEVDVNKLSMTVSQEDLIKVQEVINSKICLPENFQKLIKSEKDGNVPMGNPTCDY